MDKNNEVCADAVGHGRSGGPTDPAVPLRWVAGTTGCHATVQVLVLRIKSFSDTSLRAAPKAATCIS